MALLPDSAQLLANLVTPAITRRVVEPIDPRNPPADFKPHKLLIMVGGGKGAGKSALKEHVMSVLEQQGVQRKYVAEFGSDLFNDIFSLPGAGRLRMRFDAFVKGVVSDEDSALARATNEIFVRARKQAYAQKSPLLVDYHMDDPALVNKLVQEARSNGYETMFVSLVVQPETALKRIEERQKKTGRHTDKETALKTHRDFATHLPTYYGLVDVGMVFDNNQRSPRLIAMSKGGEVKILDGEAYEQVRKIAAEPAHTGAGTGREAEQHQRARVANSTQESTDEGRKSATREGGFAERLADGLMKGAESARHL